MTTFVFDGTTSTFSYRSEDRKFIAEKAGYTVDGSAYFVYLLNGKTVAGIRSQGNGRAFQRLRFSRQLHENGWKAGTEVFFKTKYSIAK